eukprot:gene32718-39554_t
MATKLQNFIDGVFAAPAEGHYIANINPANGEVISLVPDSTQVDVDRAVAAAKAALANPDWNHQYVTPKKRAEWLKKIADGIASAGQAAHAERRHQAIAFVHFSDTPRQRMRGQLHVGHDRRQQMRNAV